MEIEAERVETETERGTNPAVLLLVPENAPSEIEAPAEAEAPAEEKCRHSRACTPVAKRTMHTQQACFRHWHVATAHRAYNT